MKVVPLTLKKANSFVDNYHKHNKKVVGCKFCIGVEVNNTLEAVAIVGRPVARRLEEENGASLKASGYKVTGETQAFKKGTGWTTREGRVWQKIQEQKRIRWEYQI
jgi:hypothetical protein